MRDLKEEKMKDKADFQEALRLPSLPDNGIIDSRPGSSLLDKNVFECSDATPDIVSISTY